MWIFAGYWRRRELNATSVYVDSNVFMTPLLYDAPRSEAAAAVLKMIETKKISAYTSTLTWDEVVWVGS
jgi:predicted nucleic acid-binding protein